MTAAAMGWAPGTAGGVTFQTGAGRATLLPNAARVPGTAPSTSHRYVVLVGTAVAVSTEAGRATVYNSGAHGFSEVLYAFSSAGNNNGSAFAGLGANNPFYNTALGFAMLFARYWLAIPTLALAGALVGKKLVPTGPGTLPTHTPLFVVMLIGVVILVGALTFIPALALGPFVEQLMMG